MKKSGMVRKIDPLGRVVIPKEIRTAMGINEGEPLEIVQADNEIIVSKYSKGCIFCESDEDVREFRNVLVCGVCRKALSQD